MLRLWLFFHLVGFVLWLGGGFSSMLAGIRGRREERAIQGAIARIQGALHRGLIAPGAAITALSGIMLTVVVMGSGNPPSPWLMLMQGAGLVGALVVLFVSLPTSNRLAKVNPVDSAELFDALRRRQAIAGSLAGTLALLALIAGAMLK